MKTVGQMLTELLALKTKEEANTYLREESKQNENTWTNIKYITGYLGNEERNRILNLFKKGN